MNQELGSLDKLKDVIAPESISWWPLAIGWWVLFALLSLTVIGCFYYWLKMRRANAYRRQALRELAKAVTINELNRILKRAALHGFPRAEIAALTGRAWDRWLNATAGRDVVDDSSELQPMDVEHFRVRAITWVKMHRVGKTSSIC